MRQRGMPAQAGIIEIVVLIILALAIAGGAYYLGRQASLRLLSPPVISRTPQPTPSPSDEVINWKTYTNTKYGYSLKYPLSWYAFNHYPPGDIPIEVSDWVYITVANPENLGLTLVSIPVGIYIEVKPNEEGISAREYVEKVIIPENEDYVKGIGDLPVPKEINPANVQIIDINVKGASGVVVNGLSNAPGFGNIGPEVFITRDNYLFHIIGSLDEDRQDVRHSRKTFNTIISTFQFTSQ